MVRSHLWSMSDPALGDERRPELVMALMEARRVVGQAKRTDDTDALRAARYNVHSAKRALGERGPVWWTDGAPDSNRHMVVSTPYSQWFDALSQAALWKASPPDDEGG